MQGYIINFNPVKDEDLIVTVLTKESVLTLYRFYGARHSHINLGYKIDFEAKSSIKSTIPQLSGVLHLASKWNLEHARMFIWQPFVKLFLALIRGFMPAHEQCVWSNTFNRLHVEELFDKKSCMFLNDEDVERLWKTMLEGF